MIRTAARASCQRCAYAYAVAEHWNLHRSDIINERSESELTSRWRNVAETNERELQIALLEDYLERMKTL